MVPEPAEDSASLKAGLTTVTAGTLLLLVSTLLLVGLNFLARVLVVRSVSKPDFDAFSWDFTLMQVLISVGSFGIPVATARSLPYAANEAERRTVVRAALGFGSLAGAASGIALFVAAQPIGRALGSAELGFGLQFFALALGSVIVGSTLASIFQGFANVTPAALFQQVLTPAAYLGFLAVALTVPPGHVTYAWALVAFAASSVVALAALVAYTARRLPRPLARRGPTDPATRTRFLRLALPLCVFGTMVGFAGSGDTLVLGVIRYAEVGTYTASLTLARLVQVGISAASYNFLPVASGFLARGNRRAVGLTYVTVTKWLTVVSLPLFVVFVFLPSSSLDFVYGRAYSGTTLPLQVVVAGAFVGTLLGPGAMAQVATGQSRLLAVNASVAAAVDLGLAFGLVPRFGEVGAAAAWSIANVLYATLCLAELAAAERYHPFQRELLLPLAVIVAPASVALLVLRPTPPLLALPALAVGLAVAFALAVPLTGSVTEGDRLLLGAIERLLGRPVPLVRRLAGVLQRSPR